MNSVTPQGSNGSRFLAAYNAIDEHLRRKLNADQSASFFEVFRAYEKKHKPNKDVSRAVRAFKDLRNAISHSLYYDGKPIAEPVIDVVKDIERVRDLLIRPPLAIEALGRREVRQLSTQDRIVDALALVRRDSISQFPVYDAGVYRNLLTTNAIARWLAARFVEQDNLAEDESIGMVIEFVEEHERAKLCPRTVTVDRVLEYLAPTSPTTPPATAVIISESGRDSEHPLAIAVADDLPKLFAAVSVGRH